MSTATATAPAARSSRRAQANSSANGLSSQGNPERWYVRDDATRRVNTAGNPQIAQQIAEIEKSQLPASVKNSALAGLRAQLASERPLSLAISRAQKAGARDLVEVSGSFKSKLLSPALVAEIVANAPFVAKFLQEFNASDE